MTSSTSGTTTRERVGGHALRRRHPDREPRRPCSTRRRGAALGGARLLRGHAPDRAGCSSTPVSEPNAWRSPTSTPSWHVSATCSTCSPPAATSRSSPMPARRASPTPANAWCGRALDAGFAVSAVPGPAAAVMALTISGLPTSRFVFEGFLPRSGRDRSQRLAEIAAEPRTAVIYEAPHRIQRTLADLPAACGDDRQVAVVPRAHQALRDRSTRGTLGTVDHRRAARRVRGRARRTAASSTSTVDDDTIRDRAAGRARRRAHRRRTPWLPSASSSGATRKTVYALAVTLPVTLLTHSDQTRSVP